MKRSIVRRPAAARLADAWLLRHGLGDTPLTPLLAARVTVRLRARALGSVLLAVLILGASAVRAADLVAGASGPHRSTPVLVLGVLIVGLLLLRALLDAWVRRADRRAGATLARRAAHPIQPDWLELLGRPYALVAAGTFVTALALGAAALAVGEESVRYGAIVLLVALAGVGVGTVLQLRELLARPIVAEDEDSLTADFVLRIEDARESTSPAVVWSLPPILLFGSAPSWWTAAAVGFVLLGLAAYVVVHARTPGCVAMARHVVAAR
ncbi:hypothetical protein [Nonomuraea typhae]|uniref:hypothetical protein n=1 Tax=Nonomuraea typhae TaxID=2603600 RepID=UPI0012F772B3|nr:hypothetical protein [Nonomuraea typhae]